MVAAVGESDPRQQLACPLRGVAPFAVYVERQCHILEGGEGRDQVEGLEDNPDLLIAEAGQLAFAHLGDVRAIDQNLAAAGRIESGNDAKQGRFARPRGTSEGHCFASGHRQRNAAQNLDHLVPQRQRAPNVACLDERSVRVVRGAHDECPAQSVRGATFVSPSVRGVFT